MISPLATTTYLHINYQFDSRTPIGCWSYGICFFFFFSPYQRSRAVEHHHSIEMYSNSYSYRQQRPSKLEEYNLSGIWFNLFSSNCLPVVFLFWSTLNWHNGFNRSCRGVEQRYGNQWRYNRNQGCLTLFRGGCRRIDLLRAVRSCCTYRWWWIFDVIKDPPTAWGIFRTVFDTELFILWW